MNSSFANEGYLVTLNIKEEDKVIEESEILFYSRTNDSLDFDTINTLVDINGDFKSFIQEIINNSKILRIDEREFDKVLMWEEYKEYCIKKSLVKEGDFYDD